MKSSSSIRVAKGSEPPSPLIFTRLNRRLVVTMDVNTYRVFFYNKVPHPTCWG